MRTDAWAHRSFHVILTSAWLLACLIAVSRDSAAIDPVKFKQQTLADADDGESQRGEGFAGRSEESPQRGVRERDRTVRNERSDLPQELAPEFRPWPFPGQWVLGVRVQYLETGAQITQVFPGTSAWRVGLEPRDVVVSIDGYQIGYVKRRLYELSGELNARAGRSGWVRLLVQNWRNNQLVNVDVRLSRSGSGLPRERFEVPREPAIDGVDTGVGQLPVDPTPDSDR